MTAPFQLNRRQFTLGLGAAGLSLGGVTGAHAAQKIVMAESQGYSWALAFLMSSNKLWQQHGIDASTLQFTSGRLAFDAVVSGKAQFATTTDSVVALAGTNGVKSYIVGEFTRLSAGMVVVARTDRGIDTPAQLKGKRIATTLGSSGHYFLSRYLSLHGLTLKDVQVLNLRGPDAVTAITQGTIDAFAWGWDAGQQAIAAAGGKVRQLPADGLEKVFVSHYVLGASEEIVTKQPKVVEAALRTLIDAERFYQQRNADALAQVAERTKSTVEKAKEGLDTVQIGVRLDDRLIDDMVLNGEWAVDVGLAQRPKEDLRKLYRSLVYPDALRAVAPDRVKLSA